MKLRIALLTLASLAFSALFSGGLFAEQFQPGDVNQDGSVNLLDVQPFVDLIGNGTFQDEADLNQDGNVNLLDVDPFVTALSGDNTTPTIVPLFDSSTTLEPETNIQTTDALITRIGDRVRDRHAREDEFQAYDHYLEFYWEQRTVSIEIVDRVAMGGNSITINTESIIPLHTRDFRAFFRGLNTPAEYFHNVGMTQVVPTQYTTTFSFNAKTGQPIANGDRMEFEFSPFLSNPTNGRDNYYGTAFLYIVGEGLKPWEGIGPIQDSFPLPESTWLGGSTTVHYQYSDEPDNLFKQMAGHLAPVSAQPFVLGRRLHHTDFGNGAHSEQPNPVFQNQVGKLGPKYIERSCIACHVNNGRASLPATGTLVDQSVIRIGIDDCGTEHPIFGSVLQPNITSGPPEAQAIVSDYTLTTGQYADGQPYELRQPNYSFAGFTPTFHSVRIAAPLVGLGLLEAIDESTIMAQADPDDADGDGISGRIQVVQDPETGDSRLGRFGFKASQAKLIHQIAAALNTDIGVSTSIYPTLDGEAAAGPVELDDNALAEMTRYIGTLGVGAQRDYADPQVQWGEQVFTTIGCAQCHTSTLTTSEFHPWTELRDQTIHPFSDMLLHDMGPGLADNMGEGNATGAEWRTTPLWNIGLTAAVGGQESYLHDGRARTLEEAILWHGGEGAASAESFRSLPASDRNALVEFLKSL